VLKVFSVNYDSRAIDLSQNWWTGFRALDAAEAAARDAKAGIQVFEPQPEIPRDEHAFIQMHGSTHFGWIAHYVAPRYAIARHATPLARHGTPRRDGFELWNDRTALPALCMVTGFRKGEKVLTEPYASYVSYFREEAFRTPTWLLMGYGGNDPHINAALRSAADYWGDELRVYVCNWISDEALGDDALFRTAVRQRVGFLGRTGHVWPPDRTSLTDGEIVCGSQIRLTVDGSLMSHLNRICSFFNL
jgi:hypothetical protein